MQEQTHLPPPEGAQDPKKHSRRSPFHSIRFKIDLAVAINGLILMLFSLWLLSDSMNFVERDLMNERLASDIRYLRDELGEYSGSAWTRKDDALYIGDTLVGDGTRENANVAPFYHCEAITGTFFYTFVRTDNDDSLIWVEDGGYQQGHYLRTAGTTRGPNGEDLEGTYMDKKVADVLDSSPDGVYSGEANVNGRMIYCRYELLQDPEDNTVGAIVVGRSIEEMRTLIKKQKARSVILFLVAFVFISYALGLIVTRTVSSIKRIKARLNLIGTGEFPEEPLHLKSHDEMSEVAESINDMVESLKEKERIGAELSLATDIQAHMLPSIFPPFPGHDEFDLFATMDPAKEVGGDFYDFFMLDEGHLAVVIADVSGKGVPAALFMVIAKTLIKNHAQSGLSPAEVFTKVNQMLCEGNEAGLFVTAWMGILDLASGELIYVNAGHNPPLLRQAGGDFIFLRSRAGFVLAGMEGLRYRQNQLVLQPGDQLFLYTDGVTEATNEENALYGEERLAAYLNRHEHDTVGDILVGLRRDIDAFVGEAEQFDDITMLILNYQKRKGDDGMILREYDADDKLLPDVLGFVEAELEKLDCPMKVQTQLAIAVEELFVNIAHYAYDGKPGKMQLGLLPIDGGVSLRFSDRGMPFDPTARKDPDITLPAEERDVGGLGILMVKKTMNSVDYKYENGQNILTLTKLF